MKKLRVGIIGCGRISEIYAKAFKSLQNKIDVCFAVDIRAERAKKFSENFKDCEYSANFDDILMQNLDVVHICTPHYQHKQQTVACLEAGINVLCEKPIATTLEDANQMIAACSDTGKKLGIIFQNRYSDASIAMKKAIDSGSIGKVTGAWSTLNWHRPPSYYECDWKGRYATEGGGVLIDQAIHSLDLVRWLIGSDCVWIQGHTDNRVLKSVEVEDIAEAVMGFENGCLYSMYACNYYVNNSPVELKISGEKGYAHLIGSNAEIKTEAGTHTVNSENGTEHYWGNSHTKQIEEFYYNILQDTPVIVNAIEGKKTLEMVLGVYSSSKKNQRIYLKYSLNNTI